MTNLQIITNEAINAEMYTKENLTEFIELHGFAPLNTFVEWQRLGYAVKKGEKAKIKCKLWKFTNYKNRKLNEEEKKKMNEFMAVSDNVEVPEKLNHYYLTSAALFDFSQVQKIA